MLPLVYFKYHNDSNSFFANNTLLQLFLKEQYNVCALILSLSFFDRRNLSEEAEWFVWLHLQEWLALQEVSWGIPIINCAATNVLVYIWLVLMFKILC